MQKTEEQKKRVEDAKYKGMRNGIHEIDVRIKNEWYRVNLDKEEGKIYIYDNRECFAKLSKDPKERDEILGEIYKELVYSNNKTRTQLSVR